MKNHALSLLLMVVGAACDPTPHAPPSVPDVPGPASARHAIRVDAMGYHPPRVTVRAGETTTLEFTRTSDEGCGQQLVFPTLGIRRDLPLDTPVEVTLVPERGEVRFTCGMDMYRGTMVGQ